MGIILQGIGLTKEFNGEPLFGNLDIALKQGEKAALIGPNGIGKTTLMRLLMGLLSVDGGSVVKEPGISIGYLEQIPHLDPDTTMLDTVLAGFESVFAIRKELTAMEEEMANLTGDDLERLMKRYAERSMQYELAGGFTWEIDVKKIINGLGFSPEEYRRPIKSFSGGEQTKIRLACLLAKKQDILCLDEPTNHLDLNALEWLTDYLKHTQATLLIISHDRYFLDEVTNVTFYFGSEGVSRYSGNYSVFLEKKAAEDLSRMRAYEKQQEKIAQMEAYIEKYRAGIKAKQARGRQSQLSRMERLGGVKQTKKIHLAAGHMGPSGGELVLKLKDISFSYSDEELLTRIDGEILSGDRIALIGANGAGKTTLLKIILGEVIPANGKIVWGSRVKTGYFDQYHENLNPQNAAIDELIANYDITLSQARDLLASCLFFGDDVYQKIGDMSGGERARLSFLKLYLTRANFLILDEPTNHMDVESREAFENFLLDYEGTILTVSHDRYFLDAVATQVWELDEGQLTSYLGNYTDYKNKKRALADRMATVEANTGKQPRFAIVDHKESSASKNPNSAVQRSLRAKLRKEAADLEAEIEATEARMDELVVAMSDPVVLAGDAAKVQDMLTEYQCLEARLPLAYKEWEAAGRELEDMQ